MNDTRKMILDKVYEDILLNGYQGARADKVIAELGITKGALYYYFPTKLALGYSVVEEIIEPAYVNNWLPLRLFQGNPIDFIQKGITIMKHHYTGKIALTGCVLTNLIQEMSPIDEGFRKRLQKIIDEMHESITVGLKNGQMKKFVKNTIDPGKTAYFILGIIEGSYSISKVTKSAGIFKNNLDILSGHLDSLRV
jgi:TetR/AcrR family transcriptional regulator, transcriptional repressor for nem operon